MVNDVMSFVRELFVRVCVDLFVCVMLAEANLITARWLGLNSIRFQYFYRPLGFMLSDLLLSYVL